MKFDEIIGHEQVLEKFARWLSADRLASTYLFVGPPGVGKRRVAIFLAQCLLCEGTPSNVLEYCGRCPACQQVIAQTHPDLLIVWRPEDKNFIPVDMLIGEADKRMREGLCHDIALKPFRGGRKIAIIDDADFLNQEGANCLLKTLEEPPPNSIIILIASSENRQLPTIRSRSQIIRFSPLTAEQIKRVITKRQLVDDISELDDLAHASGGSIQLALDLAEPDTMEFRNELLEQLASLDPGDNDFASSINAFVDAAGKDGAKKRDRLRLVCDLGINFYRDLMLAIAQRPFQADRRLRRCVEAAEINWPTDDHQVAECILRCIDARSQIAANVNQATWTECLLSDLGRLCRGETMSV